MKTAELNELGEQVATTKEARQSILKIIDLKTEADMQKILDSIDSKFNGMDHKIDGLQKLVFGALITIIVGLVIGFGLAILNFVVKP